MDPMLEFGIYTLIIASIAGVSFLIYEYTHTNSKKKVKHD